ncbi:MAG: type II toxin-antitoxin system HipA family toxin [Rhodospirillaceae bacterium]|nr:type II toxin-antitoxin system HipA family toxin [Rhodospirillaceae bacterium]MYH36915.1 type II toxin-antitoxin system HipA family toxin [Rhodospirillaceae bacterium]MYK15387.1 type II toxin-antitoxin system HipA family toxin [Rhodospirillaceae bacterium]MYK57861.1 type II toxin-antitoxin system HipA family toxin [Rhodospirillaceae bacterium]
MTSDAAQPGEAFVWIWLPGRTAPVVAGRIHAEHDHFVFTYGRSYLARDDAIPIYAPELPLRRGAIVPEPPLEIANALRDASPDAWGRRVIAHRLAGGHGGANGFADLDELTFMLRSGSDRTGALDFQASPGEYVPREADNETLERLLDSADRIDRGLPLAPDLAEALQHGTAIGGARPKALIRGGDAKYVAKFSSSTDTYGVVKAEFIAMRLAALSGLNVAQVSLARAMNKDVLLIRRFDRERAANGWTRRALVSALTLLGLDERMAAHASYEALADIVRARFTDPAETLRELFARMTFNILVGNTDDHARNHAAFWDGDGLTLTPAYDICPQSRTGREASQAMQIHGLERRSQLSLCLAAANKFLLSEERALAIMADQVTAIVANWQAVCSEAQVNDNDQRLMWRRQFLNGLAFEGLESVLSDAIVSLPNA